MSYRRQQRPGAHLDNDDLVRKETIDYCEARRTLAEPRLEEDVEVDYKPSNKIYETQLANKALRTLFRHGDLSRLDQMERKLLSAFSFGGNSFVR